MEQFLKATGAKVLKEGSKDPCCGFATDSRGIRLGELFFALKGPNFDGRQFCEDVAGKGAWGVVVEGNVKPKIKEKGAWVFEVPNTLKALGDIAKWWRSQFSIPCVAITGSNGKTTTKEMIASILSTKWNTLKTDGNYNNLIGLPLTLNRLNGEHEAMVLEMGMNDFGEIKRLTEIASPTVGAITNAAAAHLEKLGTVEAVAKAKCELYEAMVEASTAVYNNDDPWISKFAKTFKGKKVSFGMESGSDVQFEHMESIGFDSMELKLAVQGKLLEATIKTTGVHNVMNAMTACAIALSVGISLEGMKKGLENFSPLKMRFEQIQLDNGVRLVNDAYNANPVSMVAAFETVGRAKRAGSFIAVLGDMNELGKKTKELHEKIGESAVQHGVSRLFLIGKFAKSFAKGARSAGLDKGKISILNTDQEVVHVLEKELSAGDVVLVKASRTVGLESVAQGLIERFGI